MAVYTYIILRFWRPQTDYIEMSLTRFFNCSKRISGLLLHLLTGSYSPFLTRLVAKAQKDRIFQRGYKRYNSISVVQEKSTEPLFIGRTIFAMCKRHFLFPNGGKHTTPVRCHKVIIIVLRLDHIRPALQFGFFTRHCKVGSEPVPIYMLLWMHTFCLLNLHV